MIKRILLALDTDLDTPVAIKYAIKLAEKFNASISGLAVVDLENIYSHVGGGGIGTIYYAEQLRQHMTEEAREKAGELLASFQEMVDASGVKHVEYMEEGVPFERVIEDMKYHDLLVLGRESHFFFNRPEKETETVAMVVKKGAAPTLIVTDKFRPVKKVLIACDGSMASSRTIQWFIQLEPFGRDINLDLVHICDKGNESIIDKSKLLLHLTADYLKAHEYSQINQIILDNKGSNGEMILNYVNENEVDLVVLGAHSYNAIKRLTFGSTTYELVKNSPVPLFLSH